MAVRVRSTSGCDHLLGEACARCAEEWARPPAAPRVIDFYKGVYPDLSGPLEPDVYCESPQDLDREARTRGLTSSYLKESLWLKRERKSARWV